MRFNNKVVIVTGGASGIGEETVKLFANEGAKVVIADFAQEGQKIADELNRNNHPALFVKTDVTNENDVKHMIDECVKKFGRVDVLFANAGIAKDNPAATLELSDWQRTIDVNLTGVFLCDKYAIIQMLKQGDGGVIINSGSIHSFDGRSGVTAYAASKGGVKLLTQSLAADYAKQGLRINAVCPGYVDTPLLKSLNTKAKDELVKLHPQGRLGRVDEIAKTVLFLASDDASFINGAAILVDGGYTAV